MCTRAIAKESESQVVLGPSRRPFTSRVLLVRVHRSLRVTPAMAAGVSDHVRSLEEVARLAD